MNAPVRVLSPMPAAIQREYDEALQAFWNADARTLYALQNWSIGAIGKKVMPDHLHFIDERSIDADTYWFARTHIDDKTIDGYGATALGALADMMIRAEKHVQNEAKMRREEV